MNKLKDAIRESAVGAPRTTGEGAVTGRYCFKEDFIGFSGHFPGYPILPAVVQLLAAQCLIEDMKGSELQVDSVKNAKFLQEMKPGDDIEVACMDFPATGKPSVKVQFHCKDRLTSSFIMTFHISKQGA